jgi:hypothetical protein
VRNEQHRLQIPEQWPLTLYVIGRGFALLCQHSAVLVCHSPLSQIRMEYWHPTPYYGIGCYVTYSPQIQFVCIVDYAAFK